MKNSGQTGGTPGCDISAVEAWNKSTGNNSVIVGVIDSGVDYTHEDLKDNMWINEGEIPGDGIDNDGNGIVDDVYGYNAVDDNGDPMDDHRHGTHCAGTIAASGNNGVGVAGVCWNAKIMALKFLDSTGHGDTANSLSCIEYAVSQGAKILSNSWGGGGYSYALKEMIDAAGAKGVLFVAAAGNESVDNDEMPQYPSSYACENIISVMSTDHNDKRSTFSNYGVNSVHIGAPGTSILSCKLGGGYIKLSGTSMATPHVSGAAALLLSVNQSLTPVQIKELLMNSGDPVLEGQCASGRRLNIGRALNMSDIWLSVDKTRIENLAAGESEDFVVKFAAGFADAGVYDGVVAIASNDQNAPMTNINVRMVVIPDELRISPNSSFEISGGEGGPFSGNSTTYTLSNTGDSAIEWQIESTNGVVVTSQATGSLASGATQEITVTLNDEMLCDLPVGIHTYEVLFKNLTSGVVQRRLVNVMVRNVPGTLYVDATRPDDSGTGRSWRTAKRTLQAAVAKAMDGSVIIVTNGTYDAIETMDVRMEIRSVTGPSVTSIDGRHVRRCATLGDEKWQNGKYVYSTNVVLSGFTLRNGDAANETTAKYYGGGAYCGVLTNCIVIGNAARYGGGVYGCYMTHSRFANNRASSYGGAASYSTLDGCYINGNTAGSGAGTYYGETYNSVYIGNKANSYGGGAYYGMQVGCTIVGNSTAYGGGGTYYSSITNTIVWGNKRSASQYVSNCDGGRAAYSCIEEPNTYYNSKISLGSGCISSNPLFVDMSKSVLTLGSGSPCLGKGLNTAVIGSCDVSGGQRIKDGTVDIGAYEGVRTGYLITSTVEGTGLTSEPFVFVESGGTATLTAIEIGREFLHWKVGGTIVSAEPSYTWTNVGGNITATAVFRKRDLFVDASIADDSQDGFSWTKAKRTINAAVASAFAGETIWVTNGVYECVSTEGKEVVVRSVNGAAATVIDGANTNRCAMLGVSSGSNVVGGGTKMCGFTLINGYTTGSGAGVYYGSVENCEIRNCNAVMNGGGTYYTVATNCVIASNKALNYGGGMYYGNSGNCSIIGNKAGLSAGGTYYGTHGNSVIYANTLILGEDANYTGGSMLYCCTYPSRSGTGMVIKDPMLVDPYNGDARLRVGSPCINAGQNSYAYGDYDIDRNSRIQDGRVDIGAYEGNPVSGYVISGRITGEGGLSSMTEISQTGGSATFTALGGNRNFLYFLTNGVFATSDSTFVWKDIAADGIIKAVYESLEWFVDSAKKDDNGDGLSWENAKKSIQAAIDCAVDGECIWVAEGVYDAIVSDNKRLNVKGVSGPEHTTIDGRNSRCCAMLGSYSSHRDTRLEGFTITNGRYSSGGGVRYGTLSNCVVTANLATGASYSYGGGTYYSTLYDCVVSDNVVEGSYDSNGGGMYYGTAYNCVITRNNAIGEYAYGGGTGYSTLHSCLVIANDANGEYNSYGGGTYYGTLRNCTIVKNSAAAASSSAGTYYGSVYNCIVWDNRNRNNTLANHPGQTMYYSCSSPTPSGTSNINSNPQFMDEASDDYQLMSASPCVNKGNNGYVSHNLDMIHNPRILNSQVDMGAYEWMGTVATPIISPSDGSVFEGTAQKVKLTCATEGASIYYTVDGSEPTKGSVLYTKAFNIKSTTIVKARAYAELLWASEIATAVITKRENTGNLGLAEALDVPDKEVFTMTESPWIRVTDNSYYGNDSAKSGSILDNGMSWMQTTVRGKGVVSFLWKTSCEDDPDFDDWDHVRFLVDGLEVARMDGITGWTKQDVIVDVAKIHTLRWEYVKDDSDSEGEDCAWVDQLVWTASSSTEETPVPVAFDWLEQYPELLKTFGGNYERMAAAPSPVGKKDSSGSALSIWQDFVAGTNPTNENSVFTSKIGIIDGKPVVTWEPDTPELRATRVYRTLGKKTLLDANWTDITDKDQSEYHFFRVTVDMP